MKIRIASVSGFCMGVKQAVETAREAQAPEKGTVFIDGPLIHNVQVIKQLENKGIKVLERIDDLSSRDILIIRAHGIPPERERTIRETSCTVIDCTCPLVKRIQTLILSEIRDGRTLLIVGEPGHPEITGLQGYTGKNGILIGPDWVPSSVPRTCKLAVVAQSTLDPNRYRAVTGKITALNPETRVHDTICRETRNRQDAIRRLAKDCDMILIVGGHHSENTKRLVQISSAHIRTHHIETEEEITPQMLEGCRTVGIAGGASTPDWMIQRAARTVKAFTR